MSSISALRNRTFAMVAMLVLIGAALLSVPAFANADPYPPTGPSSGVAPTAVQRSSDTGSNTESRTNETASTGFATLTATGIALALLGGGVLLVVAGRRRRRA